MLSECISPTWEAVFQTRRRDTHAAAARNRPREATQRDPTPLDAPLPTGLLGFTTLPFQQDLCRGGEGMGWDAVSVAGVRMKS